MKGKLEFINQNWMGCICACYIASVLVIPSARVNNAFYMSLIPIVIFMYGYWHIKIDYMQLILQANIKEILMTIGLSIVFLLQLPMMDIYTLKITSVSWLQNVYCAICTMITFACSFAVIIQILRCSKNYDEDEKLEEGTNFAEFQNYFYCIALVSIIFIVSCYPGLMHGDGWNIWNEVVGKTEWNDWHPIGYTFFCWVCSRIWENPFSIIIAQTVIWIYVNWYILFFLNKYKGQFACKVYTIMSFVSIMSYSYLHVMYKDVIFSICFLGFTVTLLAYLQGEKSKGICIQLIIFALLASLMRHMMIIPIMSPLLIIIIRNIYRCEWKNVKRWLLLLASIIILYCGIKISIIKVMDVVPNEDYVKYSVAMHMMAAYASNGDVDEESQRFMEHYIPLEQWKEAYNKNPFCSDLISRAAYHFFSEEQLRDIGTHGSDIVKVNWRFLTKFPREYMSALTKQNGLCWRISELDAYGVAVEPRFINAEAIVSEQNPEYNPQRNFLTECLEPIIVLSRNHPIWKALGYHAGFYIFCFLICIEIMVVNGKLKSIYFAGIIPVIILDMMLFITIPMQDSRYIMPIIQIGVLYIALFSNLLIPVKDMNICPIIKKRKTMWGIFIMTICFVLIMFVKDQYRIYDETVLKNIEFTFENEKELKDSTFFEQHLYPDDEGVWFSSAYIVNIPYRVDSNLEILFEGYCCSDDEIIEVYMNGQYVDVMEKTDPNQNMTTYSCTIPKSFFKGKVQKMEFKSSPEIDLSLENEEGVKEDFKAAFYTNKMGFYVK